MRINKELHFICAAFQFSLKYRQIVGTFSISCCEICAIVMFRKWFWIVIVNQTKPEMSVYPVIKQNLAVLVQSRPSSDLIRHVGLDIIPMISFVENKYGLQRKTDTYYSLVDDWTNRIKNWTHSDPNYMPLHTSCTLITGTIVIFHIPFDKSLYLAAKSGVALGMITINPTFLHPNTIWTIISLNNIVSEKQLQQQQPNTHRLTGIEDLSPKMCFQICLCQLGIGAPPNTLLT